MQLEQLSKILSRSENPKIEFKRGWYSGAGDMEQKSWGEFLKDIIALANGNVGYVGQPAYLIIGADDKDPLPGVSRGTFHVPSVGMLSDLQKLRDRTLRKLRDTCSPSIPDIEFEFIEVEPGKNILVIKILPSAGLLKLDSPLTTRGMHFQKGTVLIRVGQDVSVAGPEDIDALRREFQQYAGGDRVRRRDVLQNLPQPDYVRFIGRTKELARLRKLLHPDDRVWAIVIDGIGGVGKSALALETAYYYLRNFDRLPQRERFDAIVWVSAKAATLTASGVVPRQQVVSTVEDIYKTIATTLDETLDYSQSIEDQGRLIRRALTRRRTLLIIDNLESVDDPRVNAFIRELPSPTKCLITTRYRLIDVADPIRLVGMSHDDAIALIDQECHKKGVKLSEQQVDLLYKRTGGLPLAIVLSVAQIGYGYNVSDVLYRLGDAQGSIARYCFERAFLQIKGKPAHDILIGLALAVQVDTTREYLAYVTGLSEIDCIEGVVELEKLSLVSKQVTSGMETYYKIHSLVREYVIAGVKDVPLGKLKEIILRIAERYGPFGVKAISLVEQIVGADSLSDLKEKVTVMLIEQLYQWAEQEDYYGVSVYTGALGELGTKTAIQALKDVARGSTQMYYSYAEQEALATLVLLGEIEYVASVLPQLPRYGDYSLDGFLVNILGKHGDERMIPAIDDLLEAYRNIDDDRAIEMLTKAREQIMSRVRR